MGLIDVGALQFAVRSSKVGFRRVYEEMVLEGLSAKEHAASHILPIDQAQLDIKQGVADLDLGIDEVTFALLSVAGANMRLMGYGGDDRLAEIPVFAVQRYVELDAIAWQFDDSFNVYC